MAASRIVLFNGICLSMDVDLNCIGCTVIRNKKWRRSMDMCINQKSTQPEVKFWIQLWIVHRIGPFRAIDNVENSIIVSSIECIINMVLYTLSTGVIQYPLCQKITSKSGQLFDFSLINMIALSYIFRMLQK